MVDVSQDTDLFVISKSFRSRFTHMRHSIHFGHLAIAFASWPAFLVSQPACWADGDVKWMGERRVGMMRCEETVGWLVMLAVACRFIRENKLNPRQKRLFRHPLVR